MGKKERNESPPRTFASKFKTLELSQKCTYGVPLLELHHELFVTLVWVEHLFFACVKQDL